MIRFDFMPGVYIVFYKCRKNYLVTSSLLFFQAKINLIKIKMFIDQYTHVSLSLSSNQQLTQHDHVHCLFNCKIIIVQNKQVK